MRRDKYGMSSVHGEGRRDVRRQTSVRTREFEERVTQAKAENEQVKRVRFREEEEPEETRAQIPMNSRGRTSPTKGGDQRKKLDFISVEICSEGRENSSTKLYEAVG